MNKISAVIIAHNEEKHIARTLESLQDVADEIVLVLNDNTTDHTEKIALSFRSAIFKNKFETYGKQKQFAVSKASNNLVLNIDADEALDEVLQQELIALKQSAIADAYTVNIKNFYCGKWLRFGGINSTKRLRIFNRQKGNWNSTAVHEKIVMQPAASVLHLSGHILHIAYESKQEHLDKLKHYATLNANKLSAKPTSYLLFKMLFSPVSKFTTSFILKLGFLEGKQAWQYAVLMSYETYLKYYLALKMK